MKKMSKLLFTLVCVMTLSTELRAASCQELVGSDLKVEVGSVCTMLYFWDTICSSSNTDIASNPSVLPIGNNMYIVYIKGVSEGIAEITCSPWKQPKAIFVTASSSNKNK